MKSVFDRILSHPWEFNLFLVVRHLMRESNSDVSIGTDGPKRLEPVQFRAHDGMGFPATDVRKVSTVRVDSEIGQQFFIDLNLFGLYGVDTPLPLHYAVDIIRDVDTNGSEPSDRYVDEDGNLLRPTGSTPTREFVDVFNHRIISLLFRAALKYRFHFAIEPVAQAPMTRRLKLLAGSDDKESSENADGLIGNTQLMKYLGVWTMRPASASGLEGVLRDYFSRPEIEIDPFCARWVGIATEDQNRLGDESRENRLGQNFSIGDRIFDLGTGYRIEIGNVSWADYLTWIPVGKRAHELLIFARYHRSDPAKVKVSITIEAGEIPPMSLGSDANAAQLGFTSWSFAGEPPESTVSFELPDWNLDDIRTHWMEKVA